MREEIIDKRGYDENIAGSELSLKIASYPATAKYLAQRLKGKGDTVCELCCGIGVSLIELAKSFDKVIGVDNDEAIIRDCKTNLVQANIRNFILLLGDISSTNALSKIKADVVLYDIPYWSDHSGKVDPARQNPDLRTLIANIRSHITNDIVIYAPTHMTYDSVVSELGSCDFVQVFTSGKHDRNFIFLGSLIEHEGTSKITV
ncbi:MAG: class I SAM-dependent methyltransferase [Candidatus Saccharibacteria bacterium]|nr:class I SAM-dependent methyltransferase [Candidatus Saccharibacteria bacterium]